MKRFIKTYWGVLLWGIALVVAIAYSVSVAFASEPADGRPWSPEGWEMWEVEGYGLFAYDEATGELLHFCPCETSECQQPEPCPVCEECEECKSIPTQKPEPPAKCNSGRGNDSEGDPDCDPGNSGDHNQGGD